MARGEAGGSRQSASCRGAGRLQLSLDAHVHVLLFGLLSTR